MYPISLYRLGLFLTLIFLKATVFYCCQDSAARPYPRTRNNGFTFFSFLTRSSFIVHAFLRFSGG
jgi:hypothetical protein